MAAGPIAPAIHGQGLQVLIGARGCLTEPAPSLPLHAQVQVLRVQTKDTDPGPRRCLLKLQLGSVVDAAQQRQQRPGSTAGTQLRQPPPHGAEQRGASAALEGGVTQPPGCKEAARGLRDTAGPPATTGAAGQAALQDGVLDETLVMAHEHVCQETGRRVSMYTAEYLHLTHDFHHPDFLKAGKHFVQRS